MITFQTIRSVRDFASDALIVVLILYPLRLLYLLAGLVDVHNEVKWGKPKDTYWNMDRSNPNENPED